MSHVPDHVEHPSAWLDAKARRIKANANKTRARKLDAALESDTPEFRAWLFNTDPPQVESLNVEYRRACDEAFGEYDSPEAELILQRRSKTLDAWRKRVGYAPDAIRTALEEWGGLTDKQLAWARSAFAKNIERSENRNAAENARKSSAPHWTSGRQSITGVIQFVRGESFAVGPRGYHSAFSMKGILLLDDGRKCWTTIPRTLYEISSEMESTSRELKGRRITITATFSPSDDDPTMAFAKRPTLVDEPTSVESTETPAEVAIVDSSASETPQQAKARRARERLQRRKSEA